MGSGDRYSNPSSVLDIGTGFGKYGLLCREYLELWDGRENYSHFLSELTELKHLKIILLLCMNLYSTMCM